jgi:hypothetical protein
MRVNLHTSKLTHCHIKHYEWTDYSCDINTTYIQECRCACVRRMHSQGPRARIKTWQRQTIHKVSECVCIGALSCCRQGGIYINGL